MDTSLLSLFGRHPFQEVLIWILMACFVIQLGYYYLLFLRLPLYKSVKKSDTMPPVSVVICAKNEFENLSKNLKHVLDQNYPDFQVVVVNDCSWDDSGKFLEQLAGEYPNLKVVTIKEQEICRHGKKFALSLGIKAALYDIILCTDADCIPAGKNWIIEMMGAYNNGVELVIGFGDYIKKPGMLNALIRYDTAVNAIQYLSYAIAGIPYMGIGRNLSYKKSLFFENKGFASHLHILSGDDDLFVNETAHKANTAVVITAGSFTNSEPKETWGGWFYQKKRHLTTGSNYKTIHKVMLSGYFLSQILFYIALTGLLIMNFAIQLVIALYLIRLCSQMVILGFGMRKLGSGDLVFLIPLFDIMLILIYPLLILANMIKKNKHWN
jgi:poly-beta-1,6-N-acetyl-D-glucosamine synthase